MRACPAAEDAQRNSRPIAVARDRIVADGVHRRWAHWRNAVFFEHPSSSSASSVPRSSNTSPKADPSSSPHGRRLMMLGLAVAMATPVVALRSAALHAATPSTGAGAAKNADLRADFPNPRADFAAPAPVTVAAEPIATIGTVLQAAAASDADLLKRGVDAYNAGDFEGAQATLQQVQASGLSDRERRTLSDTLSKAESAANERKAARAQFDLGEAALKEGKTAEAITHYQAAIDNKFADEGTRNKSREQIQLARSGGAATPAAAPAPTPAGVTEVTPAASASAKDLYNQGVRQYKAGDLTAARDSFAKAQDAGYKPGLFQDSPAKYIQRIDTQLAANPPAAEPTAAVAPESAPVAEATPAAATEEPAAPSMTPRQHYDLAVKQYKGGDWIAARQNFNAAIAGGYRARLFQDPPQRYLARMDKKENADMAKAEREQARLAAAEDQRRRDADAAAALSAEAGARAQADVEDRAAATPPPAAAEPTAAVPAVTAPAPAAQVEPAPATAVAATPTESAQTYIEQANQAVAASNYESALSLFDRALAIDPNNADAQEGRRRMQEVTGRTAAGTSLLQREAAAINARRAAIIYNLDDAIGDANAAIRGNQFDVAATSLERARVARSTDPAIFREAELRGFDERISIAQGALERARDEYARSEQGREVQEAIRAQQTREREAAAQRESTVRGLITQTQTAIREGRYSNAEDLIQQILTLDPRNDYAIGVRPFVQDQANFADQRKQRELYNSQMTKVLNRAEEQKIPYDDIIRYPDNWPDLSAQRDRTVAIERGVQQEDAAVQAQLDKRLPELRFDAVGFSDVIDFLRDVSGANIFVNWRALEAAGIDRNAPVTARLRDVPFRKALNIILADVGGGTVKLAYSIDEGVITISTADELATNTTTQTYDIRDLIINVPDFDNAPTFSLESSSTGGGGEGGGGGGGGLFSDDGGGGEEEEEGPTREELVEQITTLIKTNIATDSWQDNGGTVGTLSELNGTLIVTQTPENQEAVSALLEKLREQRAIQVTVETRFLTVQRNFLEDIGLDFDFSFNTEGAVDDNLTSVSINNSTSDFTAAPQTGVPGTIGEAATGLTATRADGTGGPIAFTFLDDFQVNFLIRATQAAQTSTSLTAPRITLFNGQRAYVVVATQRAYISDLEPVTAQGAAAFDPEVDIIESGVKLDVQATVSSDRKYVTLTLRPELSTLVNLFTFTFGGGNETPTTQPGGGGGTVTIIDDDDTGDAGTGIIQQPEMQITQISTTVSVPDGGTLLLGGQTLAGEIEKEAGVPVLSKIPFLKRLFTNRSMAKDEQVLLILVKPTIIIQREVEDRQFPLLSSRVSGG